MKTFPNTICYNTFFEGGASGNFINTLILKFIYGSVPHRFSELGNSHRMHHLVFSNIKTDDPAVAIADCRTILYRVIEPIDESRPVVICNHGLPNYEEFFAKFPKGKIILINVPQEMKLRVISNLFFKNIIEYWSTSPLGKNNYKFWQKSYSQFSGISDPTSLSTSDFEKIFTSLDLSHYNQLTYDKPDKFNENVTILSYKDVIHDMNKILIQLSELTKKPITDHTIEFYNSYLSKQNELVKNRMPWVKV